MATLPHTRTVTYEEWLAMPEVRDAREEVVNGEIRIMPPAKWLHSEIIDTLVFLLRSQINPRDVRVKSAGIGVVIRKNPLTTRIPDVAMFLRNSLVVEDGYIHSAPQLAVEVLSPANSRRERQEKLNDYASIGIPEVWIISPEGLTVEVLYLDNGIYTRAHLFASGDTLRPKLFPDVQVEISQIWPE